MDEREQLEQQVQQQVTQQRQQESQLRLKVENLVAGIYAEACAKLIADDNPSFKPQAIYASAFEAACVFAKEMWSVEIKRPNLNSPPDSPEG